MFVVATNTHRDMRVATLLLASSAYALQLPPAAALIQRAAPLTLGAAPLTVGHAGRSSAVMSVVRGVGEGRDLPAPSQINTLPIPLQAAAPAALPLPPASC